LGSQPGRVFSALELCLRIDLHPDDPALLLASLETGDTNVPYCDARALREYHARSNQLRKMREELLREDPTADCSDIDWEYGFLMAEIRRNTKPRGGIKNHAPGRKHAYLRLRNSLARLIARAAKENPALAAYIKRYLRTDYGFAWYGDQIVLPERESVQSELPLAA
ncbi:MAG: hypothetical protein K0B87_09375, partial [Candidatus Syntrophosphaera sp.]|nr:hypothetical protein [Candidatus Syntrophosphaera sp.]